MSTYDDTIRAGGDLNHDEAVLDRYAGGAQQVEPALCCPIEDYNAEFLEILPQEIIDKDYGCGDPSKHVKAGESVVDLGSGAGKICYILSQIVGSEGRVIGVDFNDVMLDLAKKYQPELVEKIGYDNVSFVKGKIQDLALDLDKVHTYLQEHSIHSIGDLGTYEAFCDQVRTDSPMINSDTVDVVVSNCVLNLVRPKDKRQLFGEIFRVLKTGGRAVISDIVCDELPTEKILNDPDLWSGCIAGAFLEDEFLEMFLEAGFHGVEILARQSEPWQVVDGIEFRSLTVRAFKGDGGPCLERNQAVVYKGPFEKVKDDDDHTYYRGQRMAVCDKTFTVLMDENGPYAGLFEGIEPVIDVALEEAAEFECSSDVIRHPKVTKGEDYHETYIAEGPVCGPDGCC